jgi:hypothetical protein
MGDVGTFYGHLVYCTAIWYLLWPSGLFKVNWYIFPALVCFIKKNLVTLLYDTTHKNRIKPIFLCRVVRHLM